MYVSPEDNNSRFLVGASFPFLSISLAAPYDSFMVLVLVAPRYFGLNAGNKIRGRRGKRGNYA